MPQGPDRRAGPRPAGEGRPAGREPGAARQHDPVQLADRDGPDVLRLRRRRGHAAQLGGAVRRGRRRRWRSPTGPQQVLQQEQAGSGLSDQRLRRSARRASTRSVYIPCLRTDDLVFHLAKPEVRERLAKATRRRRRAMRSSLRRAIGKLFEHFTAHGARACAISLPPDFAPRKVSTRAGQHGAGRDHADGIYAADRTSAAARALRLLDAGRDLRRVQAAVRPDDRRQPRRLRGGRAIRGRTCTTAASR